MRLIYTPEDGEKREFSFVPSKLMSPEAEALENVGGDAWESFDEFGRKFMKGNRRAYRAALWILLRREQPTLKFSSLALRVDEIEVEFEDAEKAQIREAIVADLDMDPEQREHLLAEMDESIEDPKGQPGSEPASGRTASEPDAGSTDSP